MTLPRYEPPTGWEPGEPFWAAVQRGELVMPRCSVCGRWQWYPDGAGTDCDGGELRWEAVGPTGTVYSLTRVHRSFLPKGRDDVPYLVGLVDLDGVEGVRLVANLDDVPGMTIGAAVRCRAVPHGERMHPLFTLEPGAAQT